MPTIAENLQRVRERVVHAALKAGRSPESVRLVAVSKGQPAGSLREAIAAGALEIGENYVQEAEAKFAELGGAAVVRHLIGPLQRNKAGRAAMLFDMVQSIEDVRTATALGARARSAGRVIEILVEVNVSGEATKHGVSPEAATDLVAELSGAPGVRVVGLMGVGPAVGAAGEGEVRRAYQGLAALFGRLPSANRQVLSMGMTGDFELAIAEGSTMVRIGTALFGPRLPR